MMRRSVMLGLVGLCLVAPPGTLFAQPAVTTGPALQTVDAARGKLVFERWCTSCHADGPRAPGTLSLIEKYKSSRPAALEQRTDLKAALTSYFVRNGVGSMPRFRKTEISDQELAELGAYLEK